ncbi:MAG: MltA domain-containing protein [Pseudomonadota bacterium]
MRVVPWIVFAAMTAGFVSPSKADDENLAGQNPEATLQWKPLAFADLDGWRETDPGPALDAFKATCGSSQDQIRLSDACIAAEALRAGNSNEIRAFFETHFKPFAAVQDGAERKGFFTGYFEPLVAASRHRTKGFMVPLYRRPTELVDMRTVSPPPGWDAEFSYARKTEDGLIPFPDRAAIEAGYLDGRGLEIAFLESRIDAFFIHVQGSARLAMTDGTQMRVTFSAKNGHPYTSIGRRLVDRGVVSRDEMTMSVLRRWLQENPDAGRQLMQENASYIFFDVADDLGKTDGPIGAAGVPLRERASLAIDHRFHAYGLPIWIDIDEAPTGSPWRGHRGLTIAQDTGSAIRGPTRADLFMGMGDAAGRLAGEIKHGGRFVVFRPRNRIDDGG